MRLYDTLSGNTKELVRSTGEIKLYVCGITPYASAHMGHAMNAVVFDTLRRYLEYRDYSVRHIQNFTDIDDKIIDVAKRQGVSTQDVAEQYIGEYLQEMDMLNVLRAHVNPRATEEISQIIDMLTGLVKSGYAYQSGNDLYFRVDRFLSYGRLSRRTLEGMIAGARVEQDANKENPMDFVLWKKAKPGEPSWGSPWGDGRPGWHIECSAMCQHYLGAQVDIHGGGQDLIFPHHENEIAQSEGFNGTGPFVNFWMHNGLLQLGDSKMSKSVGNLVSVHDAINSFTPDAIRLFILSSHYRGPLTYSDAILQTQERAIERLRTAAFAQPIVPTSGDAVSPGPFKEKFISAMDEDLNTPQALAALFDLAREINRGREASKDVEAAQSTLLELCAVLGLTLELKFVQGELTESLLELLVNLRHSLRERKQFDLGDQIRDCLEALGVSLSDTLEGTTWTIRSGH